MQWLQSAFSSSSSPKSSSSSSTKQQTSSSPTKRDIALIFKKATHQHRRQPRLTRAKKLRHLRDIDVGRLPLTNFLRLSDNNNNNNCAPSPSELEYPSSRSSPAQPQPLPLPELSVFFRDTPLNASPYSGRFPLPSPKEVTTNIRAPSEERGEEIGGDAGSCVGIGRNSTYQTINKNTEQVDTLSRKSPSDRGKKVHRDRIGFGNVESSFRINASAMSAPGSGLSSPTLSPRRSSIGEFSPSPHGAYRGYVWSAPEMAATDMFTSPPPQNLFDKLWSSPDGPVLNPKNPRGSPMHPNISPESSTSRHESNGHGLTPKNPSGSPLLPKNSPESSASQHQNNGPSLNPKNSTGSPMHPKMPPETFAPRHESNGPSLNPKNSSGSPLHPKMSPDTRGSRHESNGPSLNPKNSSGSPMHPKMSPETCARRHESTGPSLNPKNSSGSHLHTKMSPETCASRHESNGPSLNPKNSSGSPLHPKMSPETCARRHESTGPSLNPKNSSGSPLHTKMSPETCASRHESNGPSLNPKNPSGSPLHPKMSPESSSLPESEGQASVHPLHRPPGSSVSSQTVLAHQTLIKAEVSPMISQWKKENLLDVVLFGSVYVATNRETGALCAMKEVDLIPDDPNSAECIQQLEQEIKVLSQLKHPNIVQYYGSEIVGDRFYIYLEYVHPGSINKYVRDHCGAITESVVRNFTRHILSGLAYLHSTKTIHRDIKGANLLVDASGVVKLADFGMAKHLSGQAAELSMKGSPYWMAPELIHAVNQKDTNGDFAFAVDIWSLGCTIIEIVNGKPPWSELEGAAAMFKVWKETPPIPEILSPPGKDFLQCCFTRNPPERPSASMLLEHPFLKNSHQTDVQACAQTFYAMKLGDAPHSPREWSAYKVDSMPISSRTQATKRNMFFNGSGFMQGYCFLSSESAQQSHPTTCDSAAPASILLVLHTLEALPGLSPRHSNRACTNFQDVFR
ncbi:hypothetical protein IFM89_019435, partial [Coptis chinensis]